MAALFLLSACGGGSGGTASGGKGPNSENRTTAFKSMMPDFSAMGKMVKGETEYDAEKFKSLAASFDEMSKEPFKHFTSDGEGRDGDALPNIWSDPTGYKAVEDGFHAAVANLTDKAQGGNLEEIKVAYGEVGASCKACHDTYRRPK
nr:cytochrome c [Neisseria sp. HSC-16F19]